MHDELPDGVSWRPVVVDDLGAVFDLLAADQQALHGEVDLTSADLAADWSRPSFDLATHAVLVQDADGPAGYLEVFNGRLEGGVHPRAHRRGIGSWLLHWGIERARATGAPSVEVTAPDANVALGALLTERGFLTRWESWLFWRALSDASEAPPAEPTGTLPALPPDLRLRGVEPATDARGLFDLIDTAFDDWAVRDDAWTFEDWRSSFLDHEQFEPRCSWVIEDDDGSLVGAALSLNDRGWGWLQQLAVRRDRRSQGLGTILLHRCFDSYADLGLHTAGLATESRTGARDLYERNGLVVQRSFTRWSLPLK